MKTIQRFTQGLMASVAIAAVLGVATQVFADGPSQLTAKVIRIEGDARASSDGATWHNLKVGDVLTPGSVIQTGDAGKVDILLGQGSAGRMQAINYNPAMGSTTMYAPEESQANVVRIFPSSVLAIDKLTTESSPSGNVEETQLDLRAGRILGNVKKLSSASKYEVKIPNGVAGIRGTIYLINSAGVVDVLVGSVVVATVAPDGSVVTRVVTAGNQFDPMSGQTTAIPANVLADFANNPPTPPLNGPTGKVPGTPVLYVSPVADGQSK